MNKLGIFCPISEMDAMTPVMQAVTALTDPVAAPNVTAYDWFALQYCNTPDPTWETPATLRVGDFGAATDIEKEVIVANARPGVVIVVLGEGFALADAAASIGAYRVPDEE